MQREKGRAHRDSGGPTAVERLVARYPKLYHMAEQGSWPDIKRHGLLSTSALLDLFEVRGPRRVDIESRWRRRSFEIEHPEHGEAVIRDQGPMHPDSLEPLLDGITVRGWYELLNGKTFFWTIEERLGRFLNAKAYRGRTHDVITVDTAEMVRRHAERITLAPINTGSTLGARHRRGPRTFQRIGDFPVERRRVVELAVDYSVPDLADFTLTVKRRRGKGPAERLPL